MGESVQKKKRSFAVASLVAPAVAGVPWILLIPNVAPGLVNAANGYAGMLMYMVIIAWTMIICVAGVICGIVSLVRGEHRLLAIAGIIINAFVALALRR